MDESQVAVTHGNLSLMPHSISWLPEITAHKPEDIPKLFAKMAEVSGQELAKTGEFKEDGKVKYKYTEETEVVKAMKAANAAGLYIGFVPHKDVEYVVCRGRTSEGIEARVRQDILVIDTATGACYRATFPGAARDWGDKAIYKAMTGAKKYALMETFNISTGADPETDNGEPPEGSGGTRQRRENREQQADKKLSEDPGSITKQQLKAISENMKIVKDEVLKNECLAATMSELKAEGKKATELSEIQAHQFIPLFMQQVRKKSKPQDQKQEEKPLDQGSGDVVGA